MQVTPRLEGGGVERVTLDTSRAVIAAGGRSLVASLGGRLDKELAAAGGELIRLPVHSRNPLVVADNARRLARLIGDQGVSLVHVRSRAPAFSAIRAARAARVPVVATYHGIYQARSPLKRWYNAVMTRGDLTIANSTFTRDHIVSEHGLSCDRIAVAPEGIDTQLFDPARMSDERLAAVRAAWGLNQSHRVPILLLAARLTAWKGQRLMIEVMSRLIHAPGALLILAGKTEKVGEIDDLRNAAERAGVGERVRIVGAMEDMPAAFALADLVVAPSTRPESFGRGVAEAGAMARPVLASPLGGPAETIVHDRTGWLVPAGDVGAWARAINTALALGPDARARIGWAARERVTEHFSLRAMAAATFAIYRRVLAAHS